jgi:hypothetical protein
VLTIALIITIDSLKLPINEMRKAKRKRGTGCILHNTCNRFADIAFISQKPIRGGLLALMLFAVFEPNTAKAQALWVIFYKERVDNPSPSTLGSLFPNSSYFYNAATMKVQGVKRFVELNSCNYGDKGMCRLAGYRLDEIKLLPNTMGVNCKDDTFLYSVGVGESSPEWQQIGKSALHRALKSAIC